MGRVLISDRNIFWKISLYASLEISEANHFLDNFRVCSWKNCSNWKNSDKDINSLRLDCRFFLLNSQVSFIGGEVGHSRPQELRRCSRTRKEFYPKKLISRIVLYA